MQKSRAIKGDWVGSIFDAGGRRFDWVLSLSDEGSYRRQVTTSMELKSENGKWLFDETTEILSLSPEEGAGTKSEWWVLDVTKCERANTMLVLRECILGSRNLPILLYRVHNNPLKE